MGEFVSVVEQRTFTAEKQFFSLSMFLDAKQCFAVKIAKHHNKQLTPLESRDQDKFVEPGFWV